MVQNKTLENEGSVWSPTTNPLSEYDCLGMMLYELHAPLMYLARSEFAAGLLESDKLKDRLQEPIQCLDEAARILMREDPQSPEGITGLIALQSMEQLKSSLESL